MRSFALVGASAFSGCAEFSPQQLFLELGHVPIQHHHPILLVPLGAALVARASPVLQSGLRPSLYWGRGLKDLVAGPGDAAQVS